MFWIEVLSLFSSWYDIIVSVELFVYDVWCAEDDNTDFLSVGVDIFAKLYLKERPISMPVVPMSIINQIYDFWYYVRKLDKIELCENFDEYSKYHLWVIPPPMEKVEKSKDEK